MQQKPTPTPWSQTPASWSPDWLVEDMIERYGVNFLVGMPKTNKSMLRRYLAASCMAGPPHQVFDSQPVTRIDRCLMIISEDHPGRERQQMDTIARSLGHKPEDLYQGRLDLWQIFGLDLSKPKDQDHVLQTIQNGRYDLVCVDPLSNYHRGEENSSSEMSAIMDFMHNACASSKTTFLICHHVPKPSEQHEGREMAGNIAYSMRGSSVLGGAANSISHLYRKGGERRYLRRALKNGPDDDRWPLSFNVTTGIWSGDSGIEWAEIEAFLLANPLSSTSAISRGVNRRKADVIEILNKAEEADMIAVEWSGQNGSAKKWKLK